MGNTVSAYICELKSLDPLLLYCRLRLDHCIHLCKKIDVRWNNQNWNTGWYTCMIKSQIKNQWQMLFLLIYAKLWSLDPTMLYCIDSDWTTLSIGAKTLGSVAMANFGLLDDKISTHACWNPKLKSMANTVSAYICEITHCIGGIKLVCLGMGKFGVLDGKTAVLVYMHGKIPI